jgi:hypothetical protein
LPRACTAHPLPADAIEDFIDRDRADLARQLGFIRTRVTQLLDLTLLAPDIQVQILNLEAIDGRDPLTERGIREVVAQTSWEEQRRVWGELR